MVHWLIFQRWYWRGETSKSISHWRKGSPGEDLQSFTGTISTELTNLILSIPVMQQWPQSEQCIMWWYTTYIIWLGAVVEAGCLRGRHKKHKRVKMYLFVMMFAFTVNLRKTLWLNRPLETSYWQVFFGLKCFRWESLQNRVILVCSTGHNPCK